MKRRRHNNLMDSNVADQVNLVIGLFVIASLASAYFYGLKESWEAFGEDHDDESPE
jgi:hypothetical protein